MAVEAEDGIRIRLISPDELVDNFNNQLKWPRLSCGQANQLSLEFGDLRLDDQREIVFQDNGQLRSFDDTHKLVFDRANNLLELHELGDIRFLTGGPAPTERLRILADGNVGIGTATPSQKLEVNGALAATALSVTGTVTANAFEGDGSALVGLVKTTGENTMTGPLTIQNNLTVNGALATKQLSASGNGGVEDNIEVTGTIDGRDISTDGTTLDSHVSNRGNPHGVTAVQIGALSSIDGVSNPGGNINLIQGNAITISPNNGSNQITIGENHSSRTNNPHGVTATQIGALRTSGGSLTGSLTVRQRVVLNQNTANSGYLETRTSNNRPAVILTTAGGSGSLSVYNSAGNQRVRLTVNTADAGSLQTTTSNNRPAVRLSTLAGNSNQGFLAVYNSSGQQATFLYGDGTKNFVMTHPEDESKDIIYAALEGPEAAAYIRGRSKLANGRAEVRFPEHFRLVVNPDTMTIQLTPRSADSKGLAVVEQSELGFTVSELWDGKGEYEFDYFVAGVRRGFEHFTPVVSKGFTALGEQISKPEQEPTELPTPDEPSSDPGGNPPNLQDI